MLKKPLYVDTSALDEYIAALEGGLKGGSSWTRRSDKSAGGGLKGGPIHVSAEGSKGSDESEEYADHHASRLERLLEACEADPEELGFIEITQPDTEFESAGFGALVAWECDIYQPEGMAALAQLDQLLPALEMMKTLGPLMSAFGEDIEDLPDMSQVGAIEGFVKGVDVRPVVVGEDDDTEWRVVGMLERRALREGVQLEGRVRVVGKVSKKVARNRWHPLVELPGTGLIPREERRRIAREGPGEGDEANYLQGPAVVLDVLTIYR